MAFSGSGGVGWKAGGHVGCRRAVGKPPEGGCGQESPPTIFECRARTQTNGRGSGDAAKTPTRVPALQTRVSAPRGVEELEESGLAGGGSGRAAGTLEVHPEDEFQDAAAGIDGAGEVAISRPDLSERRADVAARQEVRDVEYVECLSTELDVGTFLNPGDLHQADIIVLLPGPVEVALPAHLPGGGRSDVGLGGVEVLERLGSLLERRHGVVDDVLRQEVDHAAE